ncbi:MAG: hypothetical protein ABSF94_02590 [Steroidobacteraceae bacterium]
MDNGTRYTLRRDYRGLFWDALLYVPTVTALAFFAIGSFYDDKVPVAYLLGFLACFFLFAGSNRILTTRLMWLPSAPVAIEIRPAAADLMLKSGEIIRLRQDLKLFRDRSGRSFGLTGISDGGARKQFIFHRGQFGQASEFEAVMNCYDPGKAGKTGKA